MNNPSIYDVREDEIKIDGKPWDSPDCLRLVAKKIYQWNQRQDYWQDLVDRGQRLSDYYQGRILSDDARNEYEAQGKVIIEPKIMKSPIRSLVGQIMKGRRSGQVVTEGGDYNHASASAEEVEVINLVLKDIENKTSEKYIIRDAVHDAHVSCYPNVIYYEKSRPGDRGACGDIRARHLPWDACMFGPLTFQEPDGSDIKDLMFQDLRSQAELTENFPDMEEQIDAHFNTIKNSDADQLSSIIEWENVSSAFDRDTLFDITLTAAMQTPSKRGLIPVIQHIFPIKKKEKVWVNIFDDTGKDFVIRPPDWEEERWNQWVEKNKETYHGPYEREVRVLWVTVFTLSGIVLANEKHWFQEKAMLPASFWIGAMDFGKPSGLGIDLEDRTLSKCIAEIEFLDDLRKGGGKLLRIKEGAISNIEDLPSEIGKSVGVVSIRKDFSGKPDEAVSVIQNQPNEAFRNYSEMQSADMAEETRINETIQGETAPRQSAIAKNLEIAQALVSLAIYVDNANRSWQYHQNLKCALIPYCYTDYDVLSIKDEETEETMQVEVNAKQYGQNPEEVVQIVNDLTVSRYKWRINPVDDSPTAKLQQVQDAAVIINATAGPLIQADKSGKFFAQFLSSVPNAFLKQAGKAMAQDAKMRSEQEGKAQQEKSTMKAQTALAKAQAELLKAQKAGLNASFSSKDFATYPNLQQFYLQLLQMLESQKPQTEQPGQAPATPGASQPPQAPAAPPQGPVSPQPEQQPRRYGMQ